MRAPLLLVAPGLAVAGLGFGLASGGAQTVDGLDLKAVRARARLSPEDAQALSEVVARRGEALRQDALATAEAARAAARRPASAGRGGPEGPFDFDAMVAASAPALAAPEAGPRFIAFASLSMPPASLRVLVADVARAGGVVVFRGFPGNSVRRFTAALGRILRPGRQAAAIGVDPRLFRAFAVEAVPTYVVTASDVDLCDGFDCRTAIPPHDRMTGNVTADYALATFAQGEGPGAAAAAIFRDRLETAERAR